MQRCRAAACLRRCFRYSDLAGISPAPSSPVGIGGRFQQRLAGSRRLKLTCSRGSGLRASQSMFGTQAQCNGKTAGKGCHFLRYLKIPSKEFSRSFRKLLAPHLLSLSDNPDRGAVAESDELTGVTHGAGSSAAQFLFRCDPARNAIHFANFAAHHATVARCFCPEKLAQPRIGGNGSGQGHTRSLHGHGLPAIRRWPPPQRPRFLHGP
jgi:hypothetical protein